MGAPCIFVCVLHVGSFTLKATSISGCLQELYLWTRKQIDIVTVVTWWKHPDQTFELHTRCHQSTQPDALQICSLFSCSRFVYFHVLTRIKVLLALFTSINIACLHPLICIHWRSIGSKHCPFTSHLMPRLSYLAAIILAFLGVSYNGSRDYRMRQQVWWLEYLELNTFHQYCKIYTGCQ